MPDTGRFDRRLNMLLLATLVTLVGVILFALVAVPAILSSSSNTDSLNRSNDLAGCRSELSADVMNARTLLDDRRTDLELQSNIGLQAVADKDPVKLEDAIAQSVIIRTEMDDARKQLNQANQTFQFGVTQSRQDPKTFLAKCKEGD